MNPQSGLRGGNSCVEMILHAPSQLFFYNLSLMKFGFVNMAMMSSFLHGWLRNEKLHNPSIRL